ncbi:aspartate aminotransferase family protein [Mesorhizobium sp. M2A.F.Ca.ET.037.01.1.1]|uniref:pyridoxal phosphate-dependent decarboxylase family protein n=6 Tax=Mesorhizobium TaxID=68287 RepID=UPI000F76499A|nr:MULTISPECIES: aspartate aminotransferase family protein [unclassified Mesorhizobium]AZO38264.1 aspartate aminotransferase family protein [Mesorhizobium sp. M2A.F.Ca.ET.046.03.2.1]RUX15496.1 aspartate aminotransferase family protein [Mesorhizobium sp. M2A.F.Ca.ET.037.01.1.1]RWA90627.1 MAG: aspartate aminotransferase family protein [Mesorhizobium sp.]RWB40076.1 MAG: aspartate aminotransferase family protein [Mesorhizobium sp.]RWF37070.1 MAG: aspartate aminotransferase family protein [Mesorhiz
MDNETFRDWSRRVADWGVDYRAGLRDRPVRPAIAPGEIFRSIEASPPETAEPMERIFADFEEKIVPGMTHWQHPRFFAYFPANAAPVSVVAEYLVSAMAAQCMLWQTSPAATELETRIVDWMRQALGLPEGLSGVIQDSASSATLAAVLTMRERALDWQGNKKGLAGQGKLRVYSSDQVHTSIDRAIWVSGIGEENLVRIPVSGRFRAMDPAALEAAIVADRAAGLLPAGIIACVGGTSIGGTDDIAAVAAVAERHGLYLHVDAAWAGSAMICPEYRHFWAGVEGADSIVFNPHKWLGAQFDCSIQFIRQPEDLVRTLAIKPEFLKTLGHDGIINYSEWSVPLGRRFRALKLWFLLRAYGLEGLRAMIRNHVAWSEGLAARLAREVDFELVSEPMLSLFSFRHKAPSGTNPDEHNLRLVNAINTDGRIYLTQTRVEGRVAIRFQAGQFESTAADVAAAFDVITEIARRPS